MERGPTDLRIRPFSSEDETALRAIHAGQNLGYEWPDLSTPLMLVKLVAVDERGKPRAVLFARLTAELVAVVDPSLPGKKKTECWRLALQEAERQLQAVGMDELQVMVGAELNGLGKVLVRKYGFTEDTSRCFHRQFGVNDNGKETTP